MEKLKYSHIVWDFNGTILDDVQICIDSANVLLRRRNLPTIDSVEQYHRHFTFPVINYYKSIGIGPEKEDFSKTAVEWVTEYNRLFPKATLCDYTLEAFEIFSKANINQLIISATKQEMLDGQVDKLGIRHYFTDVIGSDTIEAHSKAYLVRDWVERTKPERAVFIGDTLHDAQVSSEVGMDCVLCANGHQSKSTLLTSTLPTFDTLKETVEYILQ